ncbi:toll/interleukin-1 receptor domain-containing protein [Lentzea indica]|uniref:toll/interleukin-1 receptor domain-containing protein n=1 Tax=Lentzea indica TaxID=2604800 RepID=UPI0014389195|nr:toll/interleukin-1 receptor domain-containing protein [Lentzea indica]
MFISYRGDDSLTTAALIDRELAGRFGRDMVFLDSQSIEPGADFVEELLGRLRTSSVLLVVIGPHWLTLTDEAGRRRVDDPTDWVRREIIEALARDVRVIPILLDGVGMPAETDLPPELAKLSRHQYVTLRRRHADEDLNHLVDKLTKLDQRLSKIARRHEDGRGVARRSVFYLAAGIVAAMPIGVWIGSYGLYDGSTKVSLPPQVVPSAQPSATCQPARKHEVTVSGNVVDANGTGIGAVVPGQIVVVDFSRPPFKDRLYVRVEGSALSGYVKAEKLKDVSGCDN